MAGRLLSRGKRAAHTPAPPTVEEIAGQLLHEPPRYPLDEQVEVTGETFYVGGIKRVFAAQGMPITERGVTLELLPAVLVPNPWNPHHPNAIAVCVGGHQVGHMPAELCLDYAPALLELGRRRMLATGEARIWAKPDAGVVRARVTLCLPEPKAFLN